MKMKKFQIRPGYRNFPARQRGAVLLVGLVIFVVLAILGVTYAQSAIMQERLAGNFKDLSVAFQSAEAGTRWPSAWLQSLQGNSLSRPFPCSGDCDSDAQVLEVGQFPSQPTPHDDFWESARVYGVDPSNGESLGMAIPVVNSQPRFVIEQQFFRRDDLAGDPQKGVAFYRATSLGIGLRKNSDAVVRAVLAKRFE